MANALRCPGEPDVRGAILVSTSPDGGATWSGPKTLNLLGLLGPNDYPTMSADPLDPRAVSIVWSEVFLAATWFARTTQLGVPLGGVVVGALLDGRRGDLD